MLFLLAFFYFLEYTIALQSQPIIHFLAIFILLYFLQSLTYNMNYDSYHETKIEWIYSFVLFSKLKYFHCLYLRGLYRKLHYWYKVIKPFTKIYISELKSVLKTITILSKLYFKVDKNYLYKGVNSITDLYYEDYKNKILKNIYFSN